MHRVLFPLVLFFAVCVASPARAAIPQDLTTTVTPLGKLAIALNQATGIFSLDNAHLAFPAFAADLSPADRENLLSSPKAAAHEGELHPIRMFIDGDPGPATLEVTSPIFSNDARHVGYALKIKDKWRVLVDGEPVIPDADAVANAPVLFSQDSQHTATLVQRDFHWIVTVDGKPWPAIADPQVDLASFSPNGKHVVAIGHTKNTAVIYEDGVALSPLFDQSQPFERLFPSYNWRPDSSAIGFYGAFPGKHWQVFTSEVPPFESPQHDAILRGCPVFSQDSSRFAFGVQAHGKWTVTIHEDPTPSLSFDEIAIGSMTFLAPLSTEKDPKPHLLYLARLGRPWRLYLDQRPVSDPFDQLVDGTYIQSSDHQHFALAVRRAGTGGGVQTVLIRDGKTVAIAPAVGPHTLAFSPDSQHVACAIQAKGRWLMAIDGRSGTADFTAIAESPPTFSPDARTVAFAAAFNPGAWRLYVGTNADYQSKPFDGLLPNVGITWRDSTHLVTIAVTKKVAQRVEAVIPLAP